jgi:hypothetical protein
VSTNGSVVSGGGDSDGVIVNGVDDVAGAGETLRIVTTTSAATSTAATKLLPTTLATTPTDGALVFAPADAAATTAAALALERLKRRMAGGAGAGANGGDGDSCGSAAPLARADSPSVSKRSQAKAEKAAKAASAKAKAQAARQRRIDGDSGNGDPDALTSLLGRSGTTADDGTYLGSVHMSTIAVKAPATGPAVVPSSSSSVTASTKRSRRVMSTSKSPSTSKASKPLQKGWRLGVSGWKSSGVVTRLDDSDDDDDDMPGLNCIVDNI